MIKNNTSLSFHTLFAQPQPLLAGIPRIYIIPESKRRHCKLQSDQYTVLKEDKMDSFDGGKFSNFYVITGDAFVEIHPDYDEYRYESQIGFRNSKEHTSNTFAVP